MKMVGRIQAMKRVGRVQAMKRVGRIQAMKRVGIQATKRVVSIHGIVSGRCATRLETAARSLPAL